ncbi:MAG: hypothetical protein R3F24_14800 [Gammaproteobacteria bacterium]
MIASSMISSSIITLLAVPGGMALERATDLAVDPIAPGDGDRLL